MSDRVAKSDPGNYGAVSWMDRWKHTSHKPSTEVHNHLPHSHGQKKDDDHHDSKKHPLLSGPEMATDIFKYAQGFREVSESRTIDTMKKSLKTGSMKFGKEISGGQALPMFTIGNRESAMSWKNNVAASSTAEPVKYPIDLNDADNFITMGRSEWPYPEMECPSGDCKLQPEGISRVPEQLVKSHESIEDKNLAVPESFQDDVGSSSKFVRYAVNSRVAPMQSFTCQHEIIDQSSPVVASKEDSADAKFVNSTFWLHEKKADSLLEYRKPGSSLTRQKDAPLLLHDQPTNNSQLLSFLNKQSQKVENDSTIGLLPSLGYPEAMKSEKAYDERFLLPSVPRSVHDLKTMEIPTTIDSAGEKPIGPSKFSQTTHQFFITKKTGVDLTEGGQVFREAMVSPKLKGNMFNEFLSLSPSFCFHGQQGVKLQPLESSMDSGGKDNLGDIRTSAVCLKNESSVETDAMELDVFQKSHLASVAFCPSDKNIKGVHNNTSLCDPENSAGKEAGNKVAYTELPDMNEGVLALPPVLNSIDDCGTSTSRTQSLDAEHLLYQAEQPSTSNTTACPDGPLGPEPSSRWVKRLKLSTSDPFDIGEVSSREKFDKMFSKVADCRKTSSGPTVSGGHVTPQMPLDQTAMLLKNSDSTSSDSVRKNQEISRSRSWIHRWCRHKAASPSKKPQAVVLCEPQSSKVTLDQLKKKQFPSIAAMALMGKAMSGFQPCEFRRRGSSIVWTT
ncbi:hypothetical protein PTKIN_Ptkin02bG0195100 [Pterospermum kingtungense]